MNEIVAVLGAFVANPTLLATLVLLAVICVGLPQIFQYLTLKSLITDLKTSIDKVNERLDKFVDFVLHNLQIKKDDEE